MRTSTRALLIVFWVIVVLLVAQAIVFVIALTQIRQGNADGFAKREVEWVQHAVAAP